MLAGALVAAVCGGLGAAIGALIAKGFSLGGRARMAVLVGCTVGAVVGSRVVIDEWVRPAVRAAEIDEVMQSNPVLRAIEAHYPASREAIRRRIVAVYEGEASAADLYTAMGAEMAKLRQEATPKASQSNTLAFLAFAREQTDMIRQKSEADCDTFVMDGTTKTPLPQLLGPDSAQKEQAVLGAILEQAATTPAEWRDTVSEAEIEALIVTAAETVLARLPATERAVVEARMAAGEPVLACVRTIAILDAFIALPPARAAETFQRYNRMNIAAQAQ